MTTIVPLVSFVAAVVLGLSAVESSSEKDNDILVIRLVSGPVRGEEATNEKGESFYSFRGIPYAEPPIGNLRFKPPVPKKPWSEILNATTDGPPCPQIQYFTKEFLGEEDCLYINVYTPKMTASSKEAKHDVVVNIPGGGFMSFDGGSVMFGPRRFPLQEAVLVSFNYRLGPLGFLSTKSSASPGNYGLLDQTEALRWVRNNIHHFGGDPNKVTILGQSAGAASVIDQMLSPLSEGLFQRAIAISGSALCPWATQRDPVYWAKKLAEDVNCPTDDSEELVRCLREKSAEELITKGIVHVRTIPVLSFTPTVDSYFLHDTPLNVIKHHKYNRNVSLMIGATRDEGNTWYLGRQNFEEDFTDEEIFDVLKSTVEARQNVDHKIQKVQAKYMAPIDSYKQEVIQRKLGKAHTDGMYHECIIQTVKSMSESGTKTYFFMYDYDAPFSQSQVFNKPPTYGVCHGDDLFALFDGILFETGTLDDTSKSVLEHYRQLIINFAKYGDPLVQSDDIDWPPVQPKKIFRYHVDDKSSLQVYDETSDDLYKFWIEEIFDREDKMTHTFKDEL